MPSTSAIDAAMANMTSVKDVRAIDSPTISCMVLTEASGRLGFTDQTAWRIALRKLSVPARSLRIANVTPRQTSSLPGPYMSFIIDGQYTMAGAGADRKTVG